MKAVRIVETSLGQYRMLQDCYPEHESCSLVPDEFVVRYTSVIKQYVDLMGELRRYKEHEMTPENP